MQFFINDQTIECAEGTTVLQAALHAGVHIPTLCFHPALRPSGSCRLCVVEVAGQSGRQSLMLSCILKAKTGMRIHTQTARIMDARTQAFERLLRMAPLGQRIRELAAAEGIAVPPAPDGCIRCRLCIRVCKEIVGQNALRMEKAGQQSFVVPEPGRCIGCGTCANLCPTHAIQVMDEGGARTIRIRDTVIGHHALERCESCGKYYATTEQLRQVEKRMTLHPHVKSDHHFCPVCAKVFSDRLEIMKKQPPRLRFTQK